jgi:hypothetical protein
MFTRMMDNSNTEDCENIPAWIRAINENPDMLHLDYTPAVYKLSACGPKAAIATLPLLQSDNALERLRAQRVLEGVIHRKYGWKPGQGYLLGSNGEEKTKALWEEMGNYHVDASPGARAASIKKWGKWLQNQIAKDE